jgi:hypothetical protein
MLTGVLYQALPASVARPSVSCRRVSSRSVLPLKVITLAAELKPTGKLAPVPAPIPYVALACGLVVRPGDVAMALMVSDWPTVTVALPENGVEEVEAGALMA